MTTLQAAPRAAFRDWVHAHSKEYVNNAQVLLTL